MFIQSIYLLLFVGILHISALPAPQEDLDSFTTEDPWAANEEIFNGEETSIEEEVVPVESEKQVDASESAPSETENPNPEPADTAEESPSDDKGSDSDNDVPSDGPKDETPNSASDDQGPSDSVPNKEPADSLPEEPKPETPPSDKEDNSFSILNNMYAYQRELRVLEKVEGDKKIICQELIGRDTKVITRKCVAVKKSPLTIFVDRKVIFSPGVRHPDEYLCQQLVTVIEGPIQQLCVTNDGWVFNPVNTLDNIASGWWDHFK